MDSCSCPLYNKIDECIEKTNNICPTTTAPTTTTATTTFLM